jgi:hypothetical protein
MGYAAPFTYRESGGCHGEGSDAQQQRKEEAEAARRDQDFGGCRCQAFLIAGDARAADPVCHLSPHHAMVEQLAAAREDIAYSYRHS